MSKTSVIAHLPATVDLSKRRAQNVLHVVVKLAGKKQGTLQIAQGSVEWWPDYKKVNAHRIGWKAFIDLLEDLPKRRSKR